MSNEPYRFRHAESDEYHFREGCYILEYLNDPADPDASIARARVPPGVATRPHYLAGTTERYLVLHGTGEARVGDATFSVGQGDVVLIPPGVVQSIISTGRGDLVFLAICTPRFLRERYREV